MRSLISGSMRARRGVIAAAAVILAFGVWQLRHADVDSLPEFSPTVVEVQTEALGLSAEEMEQLITVPLEQDLLNGVAWMDSIRSQSVPGLSSIVMEFEPGTDLYRARQVVQERLNEAHALPNVAKVPAMLQPQSSTSRAMMISLSSEELTPIQLGVLARWTIVPRLTGVSGVSNVVIWGQKERQLQVLVDPERLAQSGVTLDQVISTTGNALWASPLTFLEASTPGTGGFIDQNNQRLGVQHLSPIKTADELARVAIEGSGAPGATNASGTAAPLRLGDVAEVVEDHQALIGDAVVNGGEGLILVVEKLPDTSTTAVTAGVEDALESMEAGLDGVVVDTGIYRPATYLEDAGNNLVRSVVIGAILLVVGLAAFLFSWRRPRCSTCGRRPSTRSSSPAWSWPSPPWSTTPRAASSASGAG
jgi:Cu/Ag efflux pump CusA